jgi:fatty acid desaturase
MKASVRSDYVRAIKADLPLEAFAPAPIKLAKMLGYLSLLSAAYLALRVASSVLILFLLSILIGQILACVGFLNHELSHGAIIRRRVPCYALEFLFWALVFIPATVWRRVHNQTHHAHANTPSDPDRAFLRSEESAVTRWYTRIFYPNRRSPKWNPLVALHLVPYVARNALASFLPSRTKPVFVPALPYYSGTQRLAVVCEILMIVVIQIGIFEIVGRSWFKYLWASPVAYLITSAMTMSYIFTNHFLNPISETSDPVRGSTSVTVHAAFDLLHEHFSLHTEHHLFPGMNSDFYPLVAKSLRLRFPESYNRIAIGAAWKRLWDRDAFASLNASIPSEDAAKGTQSTEVLRPL